MARELAPKRAGWTLVGLAVLTLSGCAAGRGTYFLAKSVEPLNTTAQSDAPDLAIFAWTMADEYRRKAWDEWNGSDYQEAERLSKLAVEWAAKAQSLTAAGGAVQILDENPSMDQIRRAIAALEGRPAPAAPAEGGAEDGEDLQ